MRRDSVNKEPPPSGGSCSAGDAGLLKGGDSGRSHLEGSAVAGPGQLGAVPGVWPVMGRRHLYICRAPCHPREPPKWPLSCTLRKDCSAWGRGWPGLGSSCRSWVSIDSCCGCRGLLASPRASASPAGKWGSLFATSDYALWEPTPSLPRDSGDLVLPPRSAVIFADRCPQRCVFLWLPIPHSLPSGSSRRDALGAEPQRLSEAQKEPLRPVSVDLTREWKPGCSLWLQDWVLGVRTLGPHGVFRACRGCLHTWHFLPSVGYIRDLVESFTEADQGTGPPWG